MPMACVQQYPVFPVFLPLCGGGAGRLFRFSFFSFAKRGIFRYRRR